jgi:Tfp pilus assembly protein PilF
MMRNRICIGLLLAGVTLALYWHAGSFDFLNYDDNHYITDNPQVKGGVTWEGVRWALSATHAANWHPLTWLSHMIDVELFGLSPRGHHLTSVLLHAANVLLLLLLLSRMTGAIWPSALAAALFAVHPLRVESVAWVAERKDVLSVQLALLSLLAYVRYTAKPAVGNYIPALVLFALGLMAKPMLVTLPVLMLLLDFWPLQRFSGSSASADSSALEPHPTTPYVPSGRLFMEKIPFAFLSAGSCIITILAQQKGSTVISLATYPLLPRCANALEAAVGYLGKMAWPHKLAVFYPLTVDLRPATVAGAALFLITVSLVSILTARKWPFLVTGWFWYLASLLPVIGLVQVGQQSMADRYTYLPMIGIAIIVAWSAAALAQSRLRFRHFLVATATIVLAILSLLTWRQLAHWRNSATLYRHAIAVTDNNYLALANLASYWYDRQNYREAGRYYALSLKAKPDQFDVHHNLGLVFGRLGDYEQAEWHFMEALRTTPHFRDKQYELALEFDTRYELALARARLNRVQESIDGFLQVLVLVPTHVNAQYQLGIAYLRQGKQEEALRHFEEVVRLHPGHAGAREQLEFYRQKNQRTH